MSKRGKLSSEAMTAFLTGSPEWKEESGAISRTFAFKDYAASVAFAVRVAFVAEKRDHHPDLHISWGKVRVAWSTHDAGGITELDAEMAGVTDTLYKAE